MHTPRRPFLVKAYNALRIPVRLEADRLMRKAQKRARLQDFGEPDFQEGLERLLQGINQEAQLHPFGRFMMRERLVNLLMNRLRVAELYRKHPEIEDIEIKDPVIICGLQRTGTTRLHRLLSAHPEIRSLKSWEALNPAPISGDQGDKKRKSFARRAEKALRYMAPDFFAIHPVEHEAPEEDILINEMTFVSTVPEATHYLPSYAAWVEEQDHLAAYQYLKRVLKVMTWAHGPHRWVLKSPQYLEFLPEALQVFPDARLIHTFRDPLKVIPSFSSMVYHGRWVFSDQVDRGELARHWMRKDARMVDQALEFWKSHPEVPVRHVSYYRMMADFPGEMQAVLDFLDLPREAGIWSQIESMNQRNRQHKYGVHRYALADFGLEPTEVNQAFSRYREQFDIPEE